MLLRKIGTKPWEELNDKQCIELTLKHGGIDLKKQKAAINFHQGGRPDPVNQRIAYPASSLLLPEFTVKEDGESVTYAYCLAYREQNDGKGNTVIERTPKDAKALGLLWRGTKSLVVPLANPDKIAYMAMYPECNTSPWKHQKKRAGRYTLYNPRALAEAEYNRKKVEFRVKNQILEVIKVDQLKAYLASNGEANTNNLTEAQVRTRALMVAEGKKGGLELFEAELAMPKIQIKADVQLFHEYNLVREVEYNGNTEWRFGYGKQLGNPICLIPKGKSAGDALADYLEKNLETHDILRKELYKVKGSAATDEDETPEKEIVEVIKYVDKTDTSTVEGLVSKAFMDGVIEYDRENKRAIMINPVNGNRLPGGGVICPIENRATMREEVTAFVSTIDGSKVEKKLRSLCEEEVAEPA